MPSLSGGIAASLEAQGELVLDEKAKKRFFDKVVVDPETGCHNWTGGQNGKGYGLFSIGVKKYYAHRVAYELAKGKIPEGLEIDHLCRVRDCVNPDHLEAVTHKENLHRGETFAAANAAKTHCPQGHPLSGDNLYVDPRGRRECRTCRAERDRRRCRAKKKGADLANEADALPTTKKGTQR